MRILEQHLRPRLHTELALRPDHVPAGLKPAAVLLPLHEADGQDWLLFTRRTETLRAHRGQISFPGGRFEPENDAHMADTALRETHEEIGVRPQDVMLLGSLPPFATISGYWLWSYVGRMPWPYALVPNPDEISEIIRVPLSHLREPAYQRQGEREWGGQMHTIHYYDFAPHTIWGITGQILNQFLALL